MLLVQNGEARKCSTESDNWLSHNRFRACQGSVVDVFFGDGAENVVWQEIYLVLTSENSLVFEVKLLSNCRIEVQKSTSTPAPTQTW